MVIDSVAGLLDAVARLPEPARTRARARVEQAVARPARACRAELGLLALDLVDAARHGDASDRLSA